MTVYDLQRNDVPNAVLVYRDLAMKAESRSVYEDQVAILVQLQDDPTELEGEFDKVDKEKLVAASLRRLR